MSDQEHPATPDEPASEPEVEEVLERQRAEHTPTAGASAPDPDDEVGALITNTGLDGGPASG